MDKILDLLTKLIPFLTRYPIWVEVLFCSWVFLTATLGLVLIFSRKSEPKPEGPDKLEQAWLVIKGVRSYSLSEEDMKVRIIAKVNGNEYVYPSLEGVKWMQVGPDMSPQRFKLPPTRGVYEVSFVMEGTYNETPFKMLSQWVERVHRIPSSIKYDLHTYDLRSEVRGAAVSATIEYEITNNP